MLHCPDFVAIQFDGYLYNIFGKEYDHKGVDDGTGGIEFVDTSSKRLIGIRCCGGASYFCSKLWDSDRCTHILHSDGVTPSEVWLDSDGTVVEHSFHSNGLLTDPLDGTPANTKYHSNGQIQQRAHYRMGAKIDPPGGEPHFLHFLEDGEKADYGFFADGSKVSGDVLNGILTGSRYHRMESLVGSCDELVAGKHARVISVSDKKPTR